MESKLVSIIEFIVEFIKEQEEFIIFVFIIVFIKAGVFIIDNIASSLID